MEKIEPPTMSTTSPVHQASMPKTIQIEQELLTGEYRWFTYAPEVTGLRLICLEDRETGSVVTTTIANQEARTAAHRAWAGARQSRAAGMPWEILYEMGSKGVDPDQKLEEMFSTYGHASVGDMARLAVDMGNIPMHLCLALFNESSINSGQEKSTRYQPRFGKVSLHPLKNYLPANFPPEEAQRLEEQYQDFGERSRQLFHQHKTSLQAAFEAFYQANTNDKAEKNALTSRVLDCVRYFLLMGQASGMSFETSARDWSRIITELRASPIAYYRRFADQLHRLFVPTREEENTLNFKAEAPGLFRHTDPQLTTNQNLQRLKHYLSTQTDLLQQVTIHRGIPQLAQQQVHLLPTHYTEGERLAAQYILLLWPGLEKIALLDWLHTQPEQVKQTIGEIIFASHSNYNELPTFARTTRMTLTIESFLGELRDFNRHRAWGRFFPLPLVFGEAMTHDTVQQILAQGFGLPLYLSEIPQFADHKTRFEQDLLAYYETLHTFIARIATIYYDSIDYAFVLNLLPLAHRQDLWMHGDPRQALYLTMQRSRPGGHINYRVLAYEANQLLAGSDPYLNGMRIEKRPDPASREEFFDRG